MRRLIAALALLVLTVTTARAEITVPPPGLVVDQVGVLTPEAKKDIEDLLVAFRNASHPASMSILVIDHVPDGDIEGYALAVGRAWKLGRAGVDDGLLLVHAVGDHRYRFEVGPGLQSVLPDGAIGDIGRKYFVPWIKAGEPDRAYGETIWAIAERMGNPDAAGIAITPPLDAVAVAPAPELSSGTAPPPTDDTGFFTGLAVVIVIIVLAIVLRHSYLKAAGSAAALAAGCMAAFAQQFYDILGFSLAAALFGAFMVLIARHPGQALGLFIDFLFSALSRSSSSSSSSDSGSSDSSSFDGGTFDGGGASGSTD